MKLKSLTLLFSLFLISCIEVRDPEKNKNAEQTPVVVVEPVAEVTPLLLPHAYSVKLRGVQPQSQILRKSLDLLKTMESVQLTALTTEVEDLINQPGLYEYLVQQDGKNYLLKVRVPQDYVIEGDTGVDQLDANIKREDDHYRTVETDGRIFFKAASTLTTNGENILFKATIIDSEGAIIQTLPANLNAKPGFPGRHGGDLKFEAKSLRGTLHIFMRGENGGSGESFIRSNNGQKGGNSGSLEIEIPDQSRGAITFSLEPGIGGKGVEVRAVCLIPPCSNTIIKPIGSDGIEGVAQKPIGIK